MFKTIAQSQGKTLKDVAEEAGVSQVHLSLINTGQRRPSWALANRLAKILNMNPEDIMNHKDSAV